MFKGYLSVFAIICTALLAACGDETNNYTTVVPKTEGQPSLDFDPLPTNDLPRNNNDDSSGNSDQAGDGGGDSHQAGNGNNAGNGSRAPTSTGDDSQEAVQCQHTGNWFNNGPCYGEYQYQLRLNVCRVSINNNRADIFLTYDQRLIHCPLDISKF